MLIYLFLVWFKSIIYRPTLSINTKEQNILYVINIYDWNRISTVKSFTCPSKYIDYIPIIQLSWTTVSTQFGYLYTKWSYRFLQFLSSIGIIICYYNWSSLYRRSTLILGWQHPESINEYNRWFYYIDLLRWSTCGCNRWIHPIKPNHNSDSYFITTKNWSNWFRTIKLRSSRNLYISIRTTNSTHSIQLISYLISTCLRQTNRG